MDQNKMDYDEFLEKTLEAIEKMPIEKFEKICRMHGYKPVRLVPTHHPRWKCFFGIHTKDEPLEVLHLKKWSDGRDRRSNHVTYRCSCCGAIHTEYLYDVGHLTLEELKR